MVAPSALREPARDMFAALPVWPTTKAILAYCWRERAVALRYALVPIAIVILLFGAGTVAGIDYNEDKVWRLVFALASTLAFLPFLVTWYRTVVFGLDDARTRPLFTMGGAEVGLFMMNILVLLVVAVATLVLAGVVAVIAAGVYQILEMAGQVTAVIVAVPAVFIWFMIFTRLSVALAFAAIGQHIGIRDTWDLTKPVGVAMTLVHLILGVIGIGFNALVVGGLEFGVETALSIPDEQDAPILDLVLAVADNVSFIGYMLLTTTLFGVVYKQLAAEK